MTDKQNFLLPSGFRDLLPDDAEKEYCCTEKFIDNFYNWGYRLVSTPLLEFEDSLFASSGEALAPRTLKLIDPVSQKTVGIRADITTQVARLVESRMDKAQLPLRLCYAGDVVRSYALNTRGQRQLRQVGLELIDKKPNPSADAEIAIIAIESLIEAGIEGVTIDLNTPNLINNWGIEITPEIKKHLDKRDISNLPEPLANLVKLSGSAEKALSAKFPASIQKQIDYAKAVYEEIKATGLKVNITADFIENRGFEYHDTFSFSLFGKSIRDEIGRGGRYKIGNLSATGFTIFINSFADKLNNDCSSETKEISGKMSYQEIKELHKNGIVTRKTFN
jgi:ATP phosphoribosyltransferase regulatory subunit